MATPKSAQDIDEFVGSGHVAMDFDLILAFDRSFDHVGFFDSLLLARPYAALLEFDGARPSANVQTLSGSILSERTLVNVGVHYVVTPPKRRDVRPLRRRGYVYEVRNPAPRMSLFPPSSVRFLPEGEMHRAPSRPDFRLHRGMMLPPEDEPGAVLSTFRGNDGVPAPAARVDFQRPSSDEIVPRVEALEPGYIRVLKSWEPGWNAFIDGVPAPLVRADTFALARAVEDAARRIRLEYATPGARWGAALSAASLLLLALLLAVPRGEAP